MRIKTTCDAFDAYDKAERQIEKDKETAANLETFMRIEVERLRDLGLDRPEAEAKAYSI